MVSHFEDSTSFRSFHHLQLPFPLFPLNLFPLTLVNMSTDLHQPKRRRLDPTCTLSKPFKSPFPKPTAVEPAECLPRTPQTPKNSQSSTDKAALEESLTLLKTPSPVCPLRKPIRRRPGLSTPTRSPLGDPEILALQRQQSMLRSRLSSLCTDLDAANQALRIESSTKDRELEALIIKWRHVSQEVADEVFEGAQERVKQMGGLKAWKEQSKRDAFRWDFEDESNGREDEGEGEKEQPNYSQETDGTPNIEEQEVHAGQSILILNYHSG